MVMKLKKLNVSLFLFFISSVLASDISVILQDTPLKEFVSWYTSKTNQTVIIDSNVDLLLTAYAPSMPLNSLPDFTIALLKAHGS